MSKPQRLVNPQSLNLRYKPPSEVVRPQVVDEAPQQAATAPGNGGRVHKRHRSTTLAESEAKNVAGVDRRTVAPAPDTQEVPMQFIPVQRVHLVSAHATVGHHHAVSAQHKTLPQAHVVVPVQSVPVQNVPVRKSVPLIDDEDYGYVPPAFF